MEAIYDKEASLYARSVESQWRWIEENISRRKSTVCTKVMVLKYLLETKTIWIPSWYFQNKKLSTGELLSHRACARASDLAINHPEIVECRKLGRYAFYRVRRENAADVKKFLLSNKVNPKKYGL